MRSRNNQLGSSVLLNLLLAVAGLLTALGLASTAWARPGQITEFRLPAGGSPEGITAGPDGNLWFTEVGANAIGRITTSGQITEFPPPAAESRPVGITAGPDDNLWFTEVGANAIGRITTSGQITEFPLPVAESRPVGITAGPDGNLWFTAGPMIGRITPSGEITRFSLPDKSTLPQSIVAGPDGNLWFTTHEEIGRITPLGHVTEFPLPNEKSSAYYSSESSVQTITSGPDGNLWFSGRIPGIGALIGRIATDGQITEFQLGGTSSYGITAGPDGNVWYTASTYCEGGPFTCMGSTPVPSTVGRITPGLLAIQIANESATVHRGWTKLRLGCAGGKRHSACRGRISLILHVGRYKTIPVAHMPYSVPSGRYRAISIRLNPKALRLIFRNYPLLAGVQASATVKGGRGTSREVLLQSKSRHLDSGSQGAFPNPRLG